MYRSTLATNGYSANWAIFWHGPRAPAQDSYGSAAVHMCRRIKRPWHDGFAAACVNAAKQSRQNEGVMKHDDRAGRRPTTPAASLIDAHVCPARHQGPHSFSNLSLRSIHLDRLMAYVASQPWRADCFLLQDSTTFPCFNSHCRYTIRVAITHALWLCHGRHY